MTNARPQKETGAVLEPGCSHGTAQEPIVAAVALDEAGARRLTMRIRLQLDAIASNVEQVVSLIEQARDGNAHEPLGYKSWTAYVEHEFGGVLARLGRAERRPIVELLSAKGMSTRAIASVVGASHMTVARDLQQGSPVTDVTPAPVAIPGVPADELPGILAMAEGTDGQFEAALAEAKAEGDLSHANVVQKLAGREVTGRDGKSYSVPQAPAPKRRRRPLSDAYLDAVYDLEKVIDRLGRLHADDRFLANREVLQVRHRATVESLAEALLKLEDDLAGDAR